MKNYNRSEIMRRAKELMQSTGRCWSECLGQAWAEVKSAMEEFESVRRKIVEAPYLLYLMLISDETLPMEKRKLAASMRASENGQDLEVSLAILFGHEKPAFVFPRHCGESEFSRNTSAGII